MRVKVLSLLALALPLLALAPAHAGTVAAAGYTFDQSTDCGSFCYHDPNFSKLTDGQFGVSGWASDLGHGNAAEWVGFDGKQRVNIDFSFAASSKIDVVSIGSTQDGLWDVVLPSVEIYQKVAGNWALAGTLSVPADNANNHDPFSTDAHTFLTLSGLNIQSDQVRVALVANGPWIFADEVSFTSAVPEADSYAMLLAGFALLGLNSRRKAARSKAARKM